MNSQAETTSPFSEKILNEILGYLYVDFLESEESIGVDEHHCSLLHPCVSISRSPAFEVFHKFRLISSIWNKTFQNTVKLDRYPLHSIVEGPRPYHWTRLYISLRKSVIFGRYRVFRVLENESDYRGVFLARDFGVTGGCRTSRVVVIKAWRNRAEDYVVERKVYKILSTSPMKGFPSHIESNEEDGLKICAVVLENLGPSLDGIRRLIPDKRFDEKMTLAVAIQMVDRYAALHARGIIHNGAKPGNICLPAARAGATDTTINVIDFGCSFVYGPTLGNIPLRHGRDFGGNRQFWSALSYHGFTQSQRDDLESLGYLFSFLFHGSLPWWNSNSQEIWSIKMKTPGSVLFRDMDPSFLEYWKDVRSLAFNEVPDYCALKSRFVQCWERKGLGNLPGEYDWSELCNKLLGPPKLTQ